jgi:hypothetical protein
MSVSEETRKLRDDLRSLELREVSARLDQIEKAMVWPSDAADSSASERHSQLMRAIFDLTDLDGLDERITRIEARERATCP